jgi:ATP-binding protein involved in chromosome partitioning
MAVERGDVVKILSGLQLPGGGDPVSRDLIRALTVDGGTVRFVIEAADPDQARALAPLQAQAEAAVRALQGVTSVQVVMTAQAPRQGAAPDLKIGQHPTPQQGGPQAVPGVDGSWPSGRARAGWANPPCRRTWRWRWRGRGGGWACWMPISMAPASRG